MKLNNNAELQKQIAIYSKTRNAHIEYFKAGYSKSCRPSSWKCNPELFLCCVANLSIIKKIYICVHIIILNYENLLIKYNLYNVIKNFLSQGGDDKELSFGCLQIEVDKEFEK
jgi:hypothetical protein